jgi:hypothetical protein
MPATCFLFFVLFGGNVNLIPQGPSVRQVVKSLEVSKELGVG